MAHKLAIEAEGLLKRFEGMLAVSGVNFAVPEGVIYGIRGPNGAGKTTTLRMLLEEMHSRRLRATVTGRVERTRANFVHGFRMLEVELSLF